MFSDSTDKVSEGWSEAKAKGLPPSNIYDSLYSTQRRRGVSPLRCGRLSTIFDEAIS